MNDNDLDIYKTIYEIYLKNLDFLEKEYNGIFNKIVVLSSEIENENYKSKYELEFNQEDYYFNIINLETNDFLYENNSYDISDNIVKNTSYTKKDASSLLNLNFDTNKLLVNELVHNLWPVIKHINKEIDFNKYTFTKIYKYMFVGTGLGMHIDYINKKFKPTSLYIVEPNIEIFRLSLFITDYSHFNNKEQKLFLSVAEDRTERLRSTKDFLAYQPYLNYVIKHHLFNKEYENLLSDLNRIMQDSHSSRFSYKAQLIGAKRTINYANAGFNYLKIKDVFLNEEFNNKKILIISAGPSTKENINWIKKNKDKYFIIAVNTILPYLFLKNLKPDIIVTIDPADSVSPHFDIDGMKEFYNNIPVVMPSQVSPKVINLLDKNQIFMFQVYSIYPELGLFMSSSNVGTYALHLAVLMGSKDIYTIGNDAAIDDKTGSIYTNNGIIQTNSVNLNAKEQLIELKGNFRDKVKTTAQLLTFKNDYEHSIKYLKEKFNCTVYNLSDGAYLEGFIPLKIEDINIDELKEIKTIDIIEYFKNKSVILKKNEFLEDKDKIKKIIKLLNKFKRIKVKSRNDFIDKQLSLLVNILDISKEMSIYIYGSLFLAFLELSGLYVYFYLNVEGKHLYSQQSIQKLKVEWTNMAVNLLDEMLNFEDEEEIKIIN